MLGEYLMKRINKNKWLWWSGRLVLILVIVAVVAGVVMGQSGQDSERNDEDNKSEVEKIEQKEKEGQSEKTESEKKDEEVAKQQQVTQYEGEDPNVLEELTGTVTYAGVNNGVLMIRVSVDQYVTAGNCELTLSQNGNIIFSDTADVIGDVSTATCRGFDVSVGELGGGKMDITINLNADGKNGVIRGEANI